MPQLTTAPVLLLLTAVLAYLLGSIPFGVVITRAMGLGDLRQIGSGNIGATNVLRTGNKGAALATVILDAAKGGVAVLIARAFFGEDAAQIAALTSFLGHLFPVWLGFRGGKGLATFLGTMLALDWRLGLLACATWLVVALVTRISSAAGLASVAMTMVWMLVLHDAKMALLIVALTVLVYWKHWPNVQRLRAGTEPRIGQGKAAKRADGG